MARASATVSALALLLLQASRIQVSVAEEVGYCGQQQVQPQPQPQQQPQPQDAYAAAASTAASPLMMPCMGSYSQYGQYGSYPMAATASYGAYPSYGYSYPYSYPSQSYPTQSYSTPQSYPTPPSYDYYSQYQQQPQQPQRVQQPEQVQQRPPDCPQPADCPQRAAAACGACDGGAEVAGPAPEQRAPIINADILAAPIASMLARIVGGVKPDRADAPDQVTVQMDHDDDDAGGGGGRCPCETPTAGNAVEECVAERPPPAAKPPPASPAVCDELEHLLAFGVPQRPADAADASDVEEGCLYAGPTQCPCPPTDPCPTEHELDLVVTDLPPPPPLADVGNDVEARQEGPPPVFLPAKRRGAKPKFGSNCGCGEHK